MLFKELGSWSSTSRFFMLGSLASPLEGQVLNDGKVFIHLCNYIEPWENLSFLQRESLNHHYLLNCGCQVRKCPFPRSFGGQRRVLSLAASLFMYSFIHACIYSLTIQYLRSAKDLALYKVEDRKARWSIVLDLKVLNILAGKVAIK